MSQGTSSFSSFFEVAVWIWRFLNFLGPAWAREPSRGSSFEVGPFDHSPLQEMTLHDATHLNFEPISLSALEPAA